MVGSKRFRDRTEAGEELGEALADRGIDPDIVLAIPRGGLPTGRTVADALDAPLDVVVASKIGAPNNPEYAIGAVASDGTTWRNEEAIRQTRADQDYVSNERASELAVAREKADRYRGDRAPLDLVGKTVVLVDDGVATGSTVRACLAQLQDSEPARIVLAVPVGPPETIADLETAADDVVCLRTPGSFRGVGQFYDHFEQVSDEVALTYL